MRIELEINRADMEWIVPPREPEEGKRWSYSFVYYIEDLRNIYRIYDQYEIDSISVLLQKCKEVGLKSWSGKEWSQRNLLEVVNALKNFRLLSLDGNHVQNKGLFSETKADSPLTAKEKGIFRDIYTRYFRFLTFHQFFGDGSIVIICYMQGGRFTNRFILGIEPRLNVVGISDEHADMMRFWDVFLKWGITLGMLKKYPLKPFGIKTIPAVKGLNIVYFYKEMPKTFSVFNHIQSEMQGTYFYIPDIVYSIIVAHRYAVEAILRRLVEECTVRPDLYRAQSTSAIFVNEKEDFLFPKIGNAYITHLLKL